MGKLFSKYVYISLKLSIVISSPHEANKDIHDYTIRTNKSENGDLRFRL